MRTVYLARAAAQVDAHADTPRSPSVFKKIYECVRVHNGPVPKYERPLLRSDRLTVSTVAATVPVAATVTAYLVKATATATAMDTQMTYRDKKRLGPQPPPPLGSKSGPPFMLGWSSPRAGPRGSPL